ncbi:MAG: hypothetical protein R3E46_00640 [Sedimenticolaceae bacterium]
MSQTMLVLLGALGVELLLLVLVFLAAAFFRNRAAVQRDQRAMRALIARVKKGKPEREEILEQFLAERMGLSEPALTQARVAMLRAELTLLQRFAGVYRNREAALAARFDADLYAALEPYLALAGGLQVEQETPEPGEVGEAELEVLRQENDRLSEELRITMETMSRMLNEYSTMFSGAPTERSGATSGSIEEEATLPADTVDQADDMPLDEFDTADDATDAGEFEVVAGDDDDLFGGDSTAAEAEPQEAAEALDPTQEVLRAAAMQEQSARDAGDAVEVSVKTRPADSADDHGLEPVEDTAAGGPETDAGDIEMVLEDGRPGAPTTAVPDDLDDLFDAGDDSLKAGSGS